MKYEIIKTEDPNDVYSLSYHTENMANQKKEVKMRSEKKENYGKYIKEMYWPKASEKKKFELEKAISNIKHTSPV